MKAQAHSQTKNIQPQTIAQREHFEKAASGKYALPLEKMGLIARAKNEHADNRCDGVLRRILLSCGQKKREPNHVAALVRRNPSRSQLPSVTNDAGEQRFAR